MNEGERCKERLEKSLFDSPLGIVRINDVVRFVHKPPIVLYGSVPMLIEVEIIEPVNEEDHKGDIVYVSPLELVLRKEGR